MKSTVFSPFLSKWYYCVQIYEVLWREEAYRFVDTVVFSDNIHADCEDVMEAPGGECYTAAALPGHVKEELFALRHHA